MLLKFGICIGCSYELNEILVCFSNFSKYLNPLTYFVFYFSLLAFDAYIDFVLKNKHVDTLFKSNFLTFLSWTPCVCWIFHSSVTFKTYQSLQFFTIFYFRLFISLIVFWFRKPKTCCDTFFKNNFLLWTSWALCVLLLQTLSKDYWCSQ